MMKCSQKIFVALAVLLFGVINPDASAQTKTKLRYALGDIVSVDDLQLVIALERAKERGVEVEITPFKSEDLATQAVINGQADIGQGTPYAVIQKVGVPVRYFYQLSTLQFFPVVNKEFYKSWKDLDNQEMVVHSRGSGTEAIAKVMEKESGIKFKNVSYVPGSEVRALGMLKGNIKATILDSTNKNFLMKEAPDKFLILPLGQIKASDECLFATKEFLEKNQAPVAVIVEELLKITREINANPQIVVEERKKRGLLKDLPAKLEAEVLPYYQQAAANGILPSDGGGERAAKIDLDFFALSGQLKGENLKVEDFWYLIPLKNALAKAGK
jgi:NitT/TauT family transport system substrate-binding protein